METYSLLVKSETSRLHGSIPPLSLVTWAPLPEHGCLPLMTWAPLPERGCLPPLYAGSLVGHWKVRYTECVHLSI